MCQGSMQLCDDLRTGACILCVYAHMRHPGSREEKARLYDTDVDLQDEDMALIVLYDSEIASSFWWGSRRLLNVLALRVCRSGW